MTRAALLLTLLTLLTSLACLPPARAQALRDPTRPPDQLLRPANDAASPAASAAPQLQSVLIAAHPGGRQLAVIDGETVQVGSQWHGARVVRIAQDRVELVRGNTRQILKLHPPAEPALAGKPE